MHWFDKRYEKIFKDAAARCEFLVSLPAPYQPAGKEDQGPLREIRNTLRRRLPGCEVYYTEEECDGKILYFIEISWAGAQH
jgi:hypothetical protein